MMDSCDVIDLTSDDETATSSEALPSSENKKPNGVVDVISSSSGDVPTAKQDSSEKTEHDALQNFVDTCLKYDSSPAMQKIVKTKIWRNYENTNPAYRSTAAFKKLIIEKTNDIISEPKNIYVPVKELVDEMKARVLKLNEPPRKRIKLLPCKTENMSEQNEQDPGTAPEETNTEVNVSDRLMRRLSKTLELLHRKIKKLEEKEVSWDDENDSAYIQLQRYKERFIQVHRKLQEYQGEVGGIDRNVKRITYSGTQFPAVNRAIEKYVNKRGEFPDFFDISKLLKSTYEAENIPMSPEQLRVQAKLVFQDIGGQLQKKRQLDYWDCHCMYLGSERDPADEDSDLRSKLQENKIKYGRRIDEVIDSFVEKALNQNLEPEEVPEDDTNNSGEDSGKENENDDEEDEVDEHDNEDFVEKIIKGDDDGGDIEDNSSSDGDASVGDFVIHYGGPVSPPQADEMLGSAESNNGGEGKTEVTSMDGFDSPLTLDQKETLSETNCKDPSVSKDTFESEEGSTNASVQGTNCANILLKSESTDHDAKQNGKEGCVTPKILESLGIRSSAKMCVNSVSKEYSSPRKDKDNNDEPDIIMLD